MSERRKESSNLWPFLEALDTQSTLQVAASLHQNGKSWPFAVSRSLFKFALRQYGLALDKNPSQRRPIMSYMHILTEIEEAERFIATGHVLTSEEEASLNEHVPIPMSEEAEELLADHKKAMLLIEDPRAFKLLKETVWVIITSRPVRNQKLAGFLANENVRSFDDLVILRSKLLRLFPNDAARIQAVCDYQQIYGLATNVETIN